MNKKELKAERVRNGYSGRDMAELLGLRHGQSYYEKENGHNSFSIEQIITIAERFNLSMGRINQIFFDGKLPEK